MKTIARCTGCGCDFLLSYQRKHEIARRGKAGIFCTRECYLEWSRRKSEATKAAHREDPEWQARQRARVQAHREREKEKRRERDGAVKRYARRSSNVGLGPDKPLNPPRKCHDCGRETYDYRCESCGEKWRKRNDTLSGSLHGEEYGGFGMSAGGGILR